jgi:hypothetical protein
VYATPRQNLLVSVVRNGAARYRVFTF